MVRLVSWLMVACLFASTGGAAHAQALNEVLSLVYQTNPEIRAERAQLAATEQGVPQARAEILPQVSGEVSYESLQNEQTVNSEVFGETVTEERSFDLRPFTAGVSGQLVVFDGLRGLNLIKQAQDRVSAGEARLRATEQQILSDAAAAYFDVVRDMEIHEANRNNILVLINQLDEVSARYVYGDVTKTDVRQAEARLAGARARASSSQAQLSASRARYRQFVGDMPGSLDADPRLPELPPTEQAALDLGRVLSPTIILAQREERASRRQIAIEQSAYSPSISLRSNFRYAEEESSFLDEDEQFSYGVVASIPLVASGLRQARTREARALNTRDRSRLTAAQRQVDVEVSIAWHQFREAQRRIDTSNEQVKANTEALEGVQQEAKLGSRSTLDVLNAEQELLAAQVDLAVAKRDSRVAAFEIMRATGALGVAEFTNDLAIYRLSR
ncbi:MAG: TolC family outer membrane protein [Pseudomonadota bacterium]